LRCGLLPVLVGAGVLCSAQGAFAATLTVDDDKADCPAAAYTTVQAAVDAAATGDTVVVCPGRYVEGNGSPGTNAVTITKSLTLKGAGADLVSISPKAAPLVGGRIIEDSPNLRNGVGDIVAVVGTPTQPLEVAISGVTVDGYDPQGRPVAVEAGILFLDAKGSIVRSRVTNVVTSEGDNAYNFPGGWRGAQPGIGIAQTSTALLAPVDGARKLAIDRTRVDKYNKIGILIDGAQNDTPPLVASGAVNWGVVTASQIIGRTECVNFAGTGNCAQVGLLTSGPLFGQDGLRVTSGSYATVDSSLVSQNLVNGAGAPTRNSDANNANLTLGAGVRYVGAKLAQFNSATGQVTYSRIGTSNIVDNAYGALNVAADGTTAVTGNPNASELQSYGNLLKAEGNWWGLRFSSITNPGPAIAPTTNPQTPENPVNGTPTVETAAGATTSNSVDFYPFRDGPQANPTTGQLPILTAPIPVNDAAPTVVLSAPATAAPGTTITLAATAGDDFGIKRVRFADGAATAGIATVPPYTQAVTIPAGAACDTTRSYSAVAMDSLGQTASDSAQVTVTCAAEPAATPTATPTATATATPTPTPTPTSPSLRAAPSVAFVSPPRTIARRAMVAFRPSAAAGVKQLDVSLGTRKVCTITAEPYACPIVVIGSDVGNQALSVVLTDNAGSTAEASHSVSVAKFAPQVSLRLSKWNVRGGNARRTIIGTLRYPEGVTRVQACDSGTVTVAIKRAGRSVLNQQIALSKSCTFRRSVTAKRSKQSFSVSARFGGNAVLSAAGKTRRFS
jgi:hypothetical protein